MPDRVHILVLNHNGRSLLERCLPSVVECARACRPTCRVTVVDNASRDGSIAFVARCFPGVGVMRMPNRGLVSLNDAVRRIPEPVVLLLNNDVRLAPGCVDALAAALDAPDCFLAGPLCFAPDGRYEGTRSELCFRRGLVHTRLAPAAAGRAETVAGPTASAGAVLAVSRAKFLALGGFDPLFLPGRFEDLDLAFRGWLAGWTACYVPVAVAYHEGSATFGPRYAGRHGVRLDTRNALLFAWKNLREPRHVGLHLAFLALRLLRAILTGQGDVLLGWAAALARLSQARERRAACAGRVRSERQLFEMLGSLAAAGSTVSGRTGACSAREERRLAA